MSIESEITRLQSVKSNILHAIADKGVEVPLGSMLADCPDLISAITSGGGGGGGNPYLKNIMPTTGVKVVDENGYIGGDFLGAYYPNVNYYNNFAVVVPSANYSGSGFGTVTFVDNTTTIGGRVYRTVTINGVTWLAENLDYKFSGCGIGGSGTPSTPNAWYYNNDEATYGIDGTRKCGLLYNWHAVKLLNDNRNELIPGWHVPTKDEWTALATAVGGTSVAGARLKATNVSWAVTSWPGTDDYGFEALPAGGYSGSFGNLGDRAFFHTSFQYDSSNAYYVDLTLSNSLDIYAGAKNFGKSVRLVKDS